jgi:hypothetical protein
VSEKYRNSRHTPGFEISQIHGQTPASIVRYRLPFLIGKNLQARLRNLVQFYKRFEDIEEADKYIVFALDERLGLREIYNNIIECNAESLDPSWVKRSHLAPRKSLYHPCYLGL